MLFRIKQAETDEELRRYYHLRWERLRAPWGQVEGSEVDAIEDQCSHLIAVDNGNGVIGVARLQFNNQNDAQIRYMAVAVEHQRKGVGRELIAAMEKQAIDSCCLRMVLDAREGAVVFYKKFDYTVLTKSYVLFDSIQHYQMAKKLDTTS